MLSNQEEKEIESIFLRLVHSKNFWACAFSAIPKIAKNDIPTLQIRIDTSCKHGIYLEYNPKFLLEEYKKTPKLLEFCLAHEGAHLLLRHIPRYRKYLKLHNFKENPNLQMCFNIAADLSVNCHVVDSLFPDSSYKRTTFKRQYLPDDLFPEKFNLPGKRSMEEYFSLLKNHPKAQNPGSLNVRDHSWGIDADLSEIEDKLLEHTLEHTLPSFLREKVDSFQKRQGNLPGFVEEAIPHLSGEKKKIPWQSVLAGMLKSGKIVDDEPVFNRWNTRLRHLASKGIMALPGRRLISTWTIALILDDSGSMSNYHLQECNKTVLSLRHYNPDLEIYVIHADTQISNIYSVKRDTDIQHEFRGRGGTDFRGPISEVETKLKPDVIVYCTDGWGPAPYRKPKTPIIWCLTPNAKIPAEYGRVIHMDSGKKIR